MYHPYIEEGYRYTVQTGIADVRDTGASGHRITGTIRSLGKLFATLKCQRLYINYLSEDMELIRFFSLLPKSFKSLMLYIYQKYCKNRNIVKYYYNLK